VEFSSIADIRIQSSCCWAGLCSYGLTPVFGGLAFLGSAPCQHQRDVICLFAITELLHCPHDCFEQRGDRQVALRDHHLNKMGLAKLLPFGVLRFRDAVGVKDQEVARSKLDLRHRALPLVE